MLKQKLFFPLWVLMIFFSSFPAGAQSCLPSSHACEFYSCFENHFACGNKGYTLHFGLRLCEKYLESESSLSPALQSWLPLVRQCLQQSLQEIGETISAEPRNCSALEKKAFASHLGCYLKTGFCELNALEKWRIFRLASWSALKPSNFKISLQIQKASKAKSSQP